VPEVGFVMASRQNLFWVEIVDAIRGELEALGMPSSVSNDGFPPPRADLVYALVPPHEWFALEVKSGRTPAPSPDLLRRTVFLCGEQPGTSHFDDNVALAPEAGAFFDLSRGAVREYERRGVAAAHFQLGYTPRWDRCPDDVDRDIDILFLGTYGPRRARYISTYADTIWRRSSQIVFSDSGPSWEPSRSYLAGDDKWRMLGRAKTLLNIHRDELPYFEWARAVQALTNGCVLVSEGSTDYAPLVPGEHFVVGRPESLALLVEGLLEDPDRRRALQQQALEFVRDSLPLRDAVADFATAAEEVARGRVPPSHHPAADPPGQADEDDPQPDGTTSDADMSALRRAVKDMSLQVIDLRRTVEHLRYEHRVGGEIPLVETKRRSTAYDRSRPRVSVLTTVYNNGEYVASALGSVVRGRYQEFELIVVDDGSSDHSLEQTESWIAAHKGVASLLLVHPVNRGLPHARNTAIDSARGEFVFILDADNEVYPNGLERLVDALDSDPDAAFAYGLHQRFDAEGPAGVANVFPWEPRRLRTGNYIDAMALIRTQALRELGGYTTDLTLYGWEDYDLWCRMAEMGRHGVFVPQFIARYRVHETSMLSLTNLSGTDAFATLARRYPNVLGGVQPPL
jgi:glycosyl transferase family 2/glycosyl transferase family 1